MLSTVTLEHLDGPECDASYWGHNLRQPVRFSDAVRSSIETEDALLVEISAHPLLVRPIQQTIAAAGREGRRQAHRRALAASQAPRAARNRARARRGAADAQRLGLG